MQLTLDTIRVLLHLSEHPEDHTLPADVFPRDTQYAVHDQLVDAGLINQDDRLAGPPQFGLTRTGRGEVAANRIGYRAAIVRDRVLRAVVAGATDVSRVAAEASDGGEFTVDELEDAALALGEWGHLKVTKEASGRPYVCLPTTTGRVQLETRFPAAPPNQPAPVSSTTSYTMHNHGQSSGGIQVGDRNTMTINQNNSATIEQVLALLAEVRRLANSSDTTEAVTYGNTQAEVIEQTVEAGEYSTARALAAALLNSTTVAFGAAVGGQMVEPLKALIELLTGLS